MDQFLSNLQGETKEHFEGLLKQYLETRTLLEKKEEYEREYVDEISTLNVALEEEHDLRVSLEENLDSIEESQNETMSKLIEDPDHAIDKYKLAKKKKVEFGVVHDKLTKDLEKLTKAHKLL